MSNPEGFGRPQDKDIEKQFMKKIRGDKLQAINAECELQICLAFHEEGKNKQKKKPSKRNIENPQGEGNKISVNEIATLTIGELKGDDRTNLLELFNKLKAMWKFEQIEDDKLPQFFFDDGCDLSYILFSIQQESENDRTFSAEQLIFLQFLCLEGRGHLNNCILEYYKNNMDYLIQAMNGGLDKITKKLAANSNLSNSIKNETQQQIRKEIESQMIDESDNFENEKSGKKEKEKERNIPKNKNIKKKKAKAKRGKKKNNNSESENDDEQGEMTESIDYPKEKELAIKTCNYISWAYWYIIKK